MAHNMCWYMCYMEMWGGDPHIGVGTQMGYTMKSSEVSANGTSQLRIELALGYQQA